VYVFKKIKKIIDSAAKEEKHRRKKSLEKFKKS